MQVRSCCICLSISQSLTGLLSLSRLPWHRYRLSALHVVKFPCVAVHAHLALFTCPAMGTREPLLSLTTVSHASLTGGQCFASLVSRAYLPKTEIAGRINCISKRLRDYRISYNNVPFHFPCAVFSFLYFYWL